MEVVKRLDRTRQELTLSRKENVSIANLQPEEKKILEIKYKSPPFSQLSKTELSLTAIRLMMKINVITGWNLHEDKKMQASLVEQFELKLKESYPLVNVDEMEFAFRQNTTVKDWGKYMNLAMIDEVMIPYLNQRHNISLLEEQVTVKELPPPVVEEISDQDFLEVNRNIYKGSKLFGLIHPRCYDQLVKEKKIVLTEEQKEAIRSRARSIFFGVENLKYAKTLSHTEQERLINLDCKKLAVAQYFTNEQT